MSIYKTLQTVDMMGPLTCAAGASLTVFLASQSYCNKMIQTIASLGLVYIGYETALSSQRTSARVVELMRPNQIEESEKKIQNSSQKMLEWGITVLGLAFVYYGTFIVISNMSGHWNELLGESSCESQLHFTKEAISQCPLAQQVWDKLSERGDFTLRCEVNNELKGKLADINPFLRQIIFKQTPNFGVHALLKLITLDSQEQMVDASECSMSQGDWARYAASIEYDNKLKLREIITTCVENNGWPISWGVYVKNHFDTALKTFDTYFQQQKDGGAIQYYNDYWESRCTMLLGIAGY